MTDSLIQIRQIDEAELPLIHELGAHCFYPTYLPFIGREQVDYMFHMMYALPALQQQVTAQGHRFLLAERGAVALGFVSYQADYRPGECKVHKLYVLPDRQTGGVGRALLNEVAVRARALEQAFLILNVNRHNKAVGFYRHLGFDISATADIDIGNGYFMNDYEMKKTLIV